MSERYKLSLVQIWRHSCSHLHPVDIDSRQKDCRVVCGAPVEPDVTKLGNVPKYSQVTERRLPSDSVKIRLRYVSQNGVSCLMIRGRHSFPDDLVCPRAQAADHGRLIRGEHIVDKNDFQRKGKELFRLGR